MSLTLPRTAAALRVYDANRPNRDARLATADTTEALEAALAADTAEARVVSEAFADDTADRNSREQALLVHPDDVWLRDLVKKYGGTP